MIMFEKDAQVGYYRVALDICHRQGILENRQCL